MILCNQCKNNQNIVHLKRIWRSNEHSLMTEEPINNEVKNRQKQKHCDLVEIY